MRYIEGTIAEEVLSKVGELLPALPPHRVVKINNINGAELLKQSIEPSDVKLISPSGEEQQKDKPKIQPVGPGTHLAGNPTPWLLAGVGIAGFLLLNTNAKRR